MAAGRNSGKYARGIGDSAIKGIDSAAIGCAGGEDLYVPAGLTVADSRDGERIEDDAFDESARSPIS
jgi:hypothetical protein